MVLVTLGVQFLTWLADQYSIIQQGTYLSGPTWFAATWGQGFALAIVILPLAFLTRAPQLRAVYRAWALALALLFLFALARLLPQPEKQAAALAQILLAILAALALWRLGIASGRRATPGRRPLALAVLFGALLWLPWLVWGALGSPLDVLLNALAAYAFGLGAALLLSYFLLAPLADGEPGGHAGALFGGFAAGVALLIMGSGFGFAGSQLLLITTLPALGFALAALARFAPGPVAAWPALAILVGDATAAPLLFFDPNELQILLGDNEIPTWATRATLVGLVLAWLLGIALTAWRRRLAGPPPAGPLRLATGAVLLALVLVYFLGGQPGFYGDQLFVMLKEQPDVSAAGQLTDRAERARYVYSTMTQTAQTTQASLRSTLDQWRIPYRPYYLVNSIEVDAGPLLRAYLASRPEVERVLASPHLRPLPEPLPVARGSAGAPNGPVWNVTSVGADRVWQELRVTGKGVVVGQSDSGVQGDHPALSPGYRGRGGQDDYNWLDPWSHSPTPRDLSGHGTHTTGSVLGRGGIGLAPDAEWFACVNLERNLGNPPLYLNCMQFMLAPYPRQGDAFRDGDPARAAMVTNNSWGCPPVEGCDAGALRVATNALRAAGIFVVASAGNEGPSCGSVSDPIAIYDAAFTVGAIDEQGNVTDFSSRGPVTVDGSGRVKPDLVAPGDKVLSSFPRSTYAVESGTSMAGPQVVGVVALMWSAQPKLVGNVARTEQILRETAKPYQGTRLGCFAGGTPNDAYGYGEVDAYAAVKAALAER